MWIVHKLVFSRSPTKYDSAASCRVKMAHTCKHMSLCPTSRAISWTKHKKGSLQIRRLVLFWNWQISQRATVPSQYLWGFFTFPAYRNSFWGALPPTVSWSFLLAGSCLPDADGPASTAIWANCWVGNDSGNIPTSSNFSASTFLLSLLPGIGGASPSGPSVA